MLKQNDKITLVDFRLNFGKKFLKDKLCFVSAEDLIL